MSQEQPPLRSRRELRQARDERVDAGQEPGGPGPVPNAEKPASKTAQGAPGDSAGTETVGRNRRVADAPVDSVRSPSSAERSSQVRARDRAALRTIKELAEKEGQLAQGGALTRRQLRLQQLAAEAASATSPNATSPNPIGPNATSPNATVPPRTRATPVVAVPGAAGDAADAPSGSGNPAPDNHASGQAPTPGPGQAGASAPHPGGPGPEVLSVEQALAARELLLRQTRGQIAKMEHTAAADPEAVDPQVLAEQIALAERAAVLNRRAAAKQKLAEQNHQPAPVRSDPAAASNLAMVTPLEFVEVPGVERPVMKRPATSYVPIVTNPSPRVEDSRTSVPHRPGFALQQAPGPAGGRAAMLARAEAAARAGGAAASVGAAGGGMPLPGGQDGGWGPVPAKSAYGLDPLDAATAGLGRVQRLQMIQLAVLAVGVLAFITGVSLILASAGR